MSSADVEEIRRITQKVTDAFNDGDVDRMMRHYAQRYIDVNLPQPRQSWAERRDYYARVIGEGYTKIIVRPWLIEISGEHAFVGGDLIVRSSAPDSEEATRELRYLEIWRKTPDGWKSIWGMDSPVRNAA